MQVAQLSRTKEEDKVKEKWEGVLDLKKKNRCRLGKQPEEEREKVGLREGENQKSGCSFHPSKLS